MSKFAALKENVSTGYRNTGIAVAGFMAATPVLAALPPEVESQVKEAGEDAISMGTLVIVMVAGIAGIGLIIGLLRRS